MSELDAPLDAVLGRFADMVADRVVARLATDNGNGNGNGHAPEDRLLTADEVATKLRVQRRWVYARLRKVAKRAGGRLLYSERDVDQWLEEQGRYERKRRS